MHSGYRIMLCDRGICCFPNSNHLDKFKNSLETVSRNDNVNKL